MTTQVTELKQKEVPPYMKPGYDYKRGIETLTEVNVKLDRIGDILAKAEKRIQDENK